MKAPSSASTFKRRPGFPCSRGPSHRRASVVGGFFSERSALPQEQLDKERSQYGCSQTLGQ